MGRGRGRGGREAEGGVGWSPPCEILNTPLAVTKGTTLIEDVGMFFALE